MLGGICSITSCSSSQGRLVQPALERQDVSSGAALAHAELGVLGVERIWSVAQGAGVVVAVIDSGVDGKQRALLKRVLPGYDVISGGAADHDIARHGTGIAGLVAATPDQEPGVIGTAPKALILPVRVTVGPAASVQKVAEGIRWAANHGADVVVLAYATPSWDSDVLDAVALATSHGVLTVVSAGNRGALSKVPPLDGAVVVASSADGEALQPYSGPATLGGVVAPGGDADPSGRSLLTLAPGGGSQKVAGTSVSVALVGGVLALLRSARPEIRPDVVRDCVLSTARDLGPPGLDETFGFGMVDGHGALWCVERAS